MKMPSRNSKSVRISGIGSRSPGRSYVVKYSDGSFTVKDIFQFTKPPPPKPFSEGVEKLCGGLLDQLKPENAQQVKTIVIGRFFYKNTPFVSEFSDFLANQMVVALQRRAGRPVMGRGDLLRAANGDAAVVSDIINGARTQPATSSGGASTALITGNFWPSASDARTVHVQTRVEETSSGLLLSAADADLALGDLNAQVEPSDSEKAQGL